MRLIDADELKKCAIPCEIHQGSLTELCVPLYQIDNAPTVDLWQMRQEATENAFKKAEALYARPEDDKKERTCPFCKTELLQPLYMYRDFHCPYCGENIGGSK